jgi:CMP-2-keto-3-deoxyoctulosonic acid synthetase
MSMPVIIIINIVGDEPCCYVEYVALIIILLERCQSCELQR